MEIDNADKRKSFIRKKAMAAAAITGVAGTGYLAGKIKSVKNGLSNPRDPFVWKPGRGSSVFLKGADILDVHRGQVLRQRGIVFTDGQITEVVSTRNLDKVTADRTFDCTGLFIMPSLLNSHVHAFMPCASMMSLDLVLTMKRQAERNLEECARHGVTTVRDTGGLPLLLNEAARQIEMFNMLGPRIVSSGSIIMVKGGYPQFAPPLPPWLAKRFGSPSIQVRDPESARKAVVSTVEQGARFIKIFFDDRSYFYGQRPLNTFDDETVKAIIDEAHRQGKRVGVHQSQISGFRRAVEFDVDDFEHVPGDSALEEKDVEAFMKGNHFVTPTACVPMALGIVPKEHPSWSDPDIAKMHVARERLLYDICPAFAEEAIVRSNKKMVKLYLDGALAKKREPNFYCDSEIFIQEMAESGRNILKLYEAGAVICCGNDGGTPLGFPGALFLEMEILEWLGLKRIDILRSATINAAKLMDLDDELGAIEPGKLADLVVLSADPTKDIRAVEQVEAVFRSGALLHRGYRFPM